MTEPLAQWGLLLFSAAIVAIVTRKDLIFSVLLPPLVFEAAIHIKRPDVKVDLGIVILLATIGVLIAAAITAAGMHYGVNWTWSEAALFGVLISATDPVSVIATFKETGVTGAITSLSRSGKSAQCSGNTSPFLPTLSCFC